MWSKHAVTWPLDRLQLEVCLADAQRLSWGAIDPGSAEMVGHASVRRDQDGRRMHLGHLIADPARRGRGMGRALTELTVREGFGATDLPAMTVGVDAYDTPAIGRYQSLGFHKTGHVEHREVDGEVWDVLERKLSRTHQHH